MNIIWRLIQSQLKQRIGYLIIVFFIVAVISASPYAFSFLGKWLVDEVLQVTGPPKTKVSSESSENGESAEENKISIQWKAKTTDEKIRLLKIFFIISISIHLVVTGLSALSELIKSRINNRMVYELRTSVHEKIGSMNMGFFAREQVGQFMTRIMDDAGGIPGNLTQLVINFFTQIAMLILGATLLFRLNPRMALFALAALPFYVLICLVFLPRIKKNAEELRIRGASFNGFVIERLSNVATIKNYAQEDRELKAFSNTLDDNMKLNRKQQNLNLGFGTLTTIVTSLGTLAALFFGFLNIKSGKMQLGQVMAFYQVTAQLFVPISALVGLTTVVQNLQVLGFRVFSVLDTPATMEDAPDAVQITEFRGDIEFEDVSLRYEEEGPFAVEEIKLSIPAGTSACIVGPTGCGKSTLLILLSRLYDPTEGVINIDGMDIRKIPIKDLRRAVTHVLHETQVFSGTIGENISYGAPDASFTDIQHAARVVGLHDFIQSQENGYKTKIGRGGISLDADQLVKLNMARALVTRPSILTVDDTYSAIEEDIEKEIRKAIREFLVEKTILIATSRLSICEDADLVIVMQEGKVIQTGSHKELLASPGLYRRMYMRQMGLEEAEVSLNDK
ncbi:ATP-binding cassette domain-containing protein [Candidatus Poribacteria bacterium]|nr:ATP-binding cassette domain-containing protein [Candidatus Poribacteria bacterium]